MTRLNISHEILTSSFRIRLAPRDRELLFALAELEERTPSDMLRRLIRHAGRNLGVKTNEENGPRLPSAGSK